MTTSRSSRSTRAGSFRRRLTAALITGTLLAATGAFGVGTAAAAINPAATALDIANAIKSPSANVTSASFTSVTGGTPNGTSTALDGFPTNGSTFGILTTGNVDSVDDTGIFASTPNGGTPVRGNTDLDVTVLKVDIAVPTGANCLTFDFKFLSEEYPGFVGGAYNDAFIAELDGTTWTTSGSAITAPNNFAFDADGDVVSVNATGIGGMSAGEGAGTAFDGGANHGGATVLLHASRQVTTGDHSVYFSIFDQGDAAYDSAVFLDNLVVGFVPNPATNCTAGASPVSYQLGLTPASAINPVGTPHTVTATLTDAEGAVVSGQTINFTVAGANARTGTGTTNGSGQATFTYTGTNAGQDQINACIIVVGECAASASATKDWNPGVTVTCPANQTCNATTTSVGGGTTATVTAGPGATITASFSTLPVANFTACGTSTPRDANGVLTFNATGSKLPKLVKFVVANGKPFLVCWNAPVKFKQRGGTWSAPDPISGSGFTGLLPECLSKNPTLPCVLPVIVKASAATASVYVLAPAGDPKGFIAR
jgi:Bacterial Ig-like domain (group 1)